MILAVVIGFVGMVSGLILSYYPDTPVSATITLLFVSFFLLSNLFVKFRKLGDLMKKLAWLVLSFCSLLLVACSGGQNQVREIESHDYFLSCTMNLLSKSLETREMWSSWSGLVRNPMILNCLPRGAQKSKSQMSCLWEWEHGTWVPQLLKSMDGRNKGCQSDGEYASFTRWWRRAWPWGRGRTSSWLWSPCLAFSTESY